MSMKKIPMRKCVGCQEMKGKKDLMRVLKTPEDELIIDATSRKNGRGAYLCRSMECFELAIKNKGLERSLKTSIPADVYDSLKKEIEQIDPK